MRKVENHHKANSSYNCFRQESSIDTKISEEKKDEKQNP